LRNGQKQVQAASANHSGSANPTAGNAAIKSLSEQSGQSEQSEDPALASNAANGNARRPSGTAGETPHSRPETAARAALAIETHGKRPSQLDHADAQARMPSPQDPSANPSPIAGVSLASLAIPVPPAASPAGTVSGSDLAESRFQLFNGLNSTGELNSTGSILAEEAARPVELRPHTTDHSAGQSTRESSSSLQQENQIGGTSTAQISIPESRNSDPAADTVAPPSTNPDAHRSQTVERIHPAIASSAKGRGPGTASLPTGMAAPGVAPNAVAPHHGSLQASLRVSNATRTEQDFERGDAFKSLDMEAEHASLPSIRWVHTGAQQAEAGFEDPALGWVSVRANGGVAGVHPALIPSSAEAAQVLAGHLAGLNSFLANRSPGVGDVIVASPESGASGMGTQAGSGQGSHEQHREGAAQEANSTMTLGAGADNRSGSSISRQLEPNLASGVSAATLQAPGAAHISVMV
jgi:hypothetical protein